MNLKIKKYQWHLRVLGYFYIVRRLDQRIESNSSTLKVVSILNKEKGWQVLDYYVK